MWRRPREPLGRAFAATTIVECDLGGMPCRRTVRRTSVRMQARRLHAGTIEATARSSRNQDSNRHPYRGTMQDDALSLENIP